MAGDGCTNFTLLRLSLSLSDTLSTLTLYLFSWEKHATLLFFLTHSIVQGSFFYANRQVFPCTFPLPLLLPLNHSPLPSIQHPTSTSIPDFSSQPHSLTSYTTTLTLTSYTTHTHTHHNIRSLHFPTLIIYLFFSLQTYTLGHASNASRPFFIPFFHNILHTFFSFVFYVFVFLSLFSSPLLQL
ncbi:MAG: hypothetical protein J3R72DRAFT_451682 [Linnemannia gamsii]|nr:MAG: hypothetical protein J3R72DRAFT_451682 [Linnemannia gamsii]